LVIGLLLGKCMCLLTLAPIELGYLALYGGAHPVLGGGFRCADSPASTAPGLTCELCIVSSDDPPETRRTYEFRKLPGLPLLWLTGLTTQTRSEGRGWSPSILPNGSCTPPLPVPPFAEPTPRIMSAGLCFGG
jgi:hypothetical protein